MRKIEHHNMIDRYLLGQTTPEERAEIADRAKNDPAFAKELELHKSLQNLVTDYSVVLIREKLRNIHLGKNIKTRSGKDFLKNILIIGSSAIIVSISIWLLLKKEDMAVRSPSEAPVTSEAFTDSTPVATGEQLTTAIKPAGDLRKTGRHAKHEFNKINHTGTSRKESTCKNKTMVTKSMGPDLSRSLLSDSAALPPIIQKTPAPVVTPADSCSIHADYTSEPSCNNIPSGIIRVDRRSISGGTPPYLFTIDRIYGETMAFTNLIPGTYYIKIKDSLDCEQEIGPIKVGIKNCYTDTSFSPAYGEIWDIPLELNQPGMITIFSKAGSVVYKLRLNGSGKESWNGMSDANEMLPMGVYPFRIVYENGNVLEGTVTIVN